MEIQTDTYSGRVVFPSGLRTPDEVRHLVLRPAQQLGAYLKQTAIKRALELTEVNLDRHGSVEFRFGMVMEELVTNIVYHDILDLHAEDRMAVFTEDVGTPPPELLERFERQLELVGGREGVVTLFVEVGQIRVVVELTREFPEFNDKWAVLTAPGYEPDLVKPHGRGIHLVASFCAAGAYVPDPPRLEFLFTVE